MSVNFVRPRISHRPELCLLWFHHAGATSAAYSRWYKYFPVEWQLLFIELPGRDGRDPAASLQQLTQEIAQKFRTQNYKCPVALFGHSFGALLAYELARLMACHNQVIWLGVSGRVAPHMPLPFSLPLAASSDEILIETLRRIGGTSEDILSDLTWREYFLPMYRADLALLESHGYSLAETLNIPMTVFSGRNDSLVNEEGLTGWNALTKSHCRHLKFDGDHFYLMTDSERIASAIQSELRLTLSLI